jgi:cytochrome c oxidase subunit I
VLPMILTLLYHVVGSRRRAPVNSGADRTGLFLYVVGGISFCMVFLYAGHLSVARRFAVHLPEWVPSDRAGSIAAMVLILGMLVFVTRIIVGLLKAPADVDPAHRTG